MDKMFSVFKNLSLFKKIIIVAISVAVVVWLIRFFGSSKSLNYDVYTVKKGSISEQIIISGNANATANAIVYSPSTGIVEELFVKNGDSVKANQILMKVKSTAMELDKSNALAAYQAAIAALNTSKQTKITNQSSLESARKTVIDASVAQQQMTNRRNEGLSNPATGKPYTQDEIDSINSLTTSTKNAFTASEQKYLSSDAGIASAQSAVSAAQLAYQSTVNGTIKAPIAGTIMNLAVGSGDYVTAKLTTATATVETVPVLRIATSDSITILVKLNEIDIAKVRPDQKAIVVFDALTDTTFEGVVSRIDEVGTNANAVVTFNAYITIQNTDPRIRPAMTATVTIQTDTKQNVFTVPNVSLKKENNRVTVLKKQANSEVTVPVIVGMKNGTESEITSGIADGDSILVPKAK